MSARTFGDADALRPDPILGERDVLQSVRAIGREVLGAVVRGSERPPGRVQRVHVYYLVPDFHFERRREVLELLHLSLIPFLWRVRRTRYYRTRRGVLRGLRNVLRYRSLFRSIRARGLLEDESRPARLPWLFASHECICRLDGHHRASIARFLGHEHVHALVVTPADLRGLDALSDRDRVLLDRLHETDLDLADRRAAGRCAR